jgi:hypothetical protein
MAHWPLAPSCNLTYPPCYVVRIGTVVVIERPVLVDSRSHRQSVVFWQACKLPTSQRRPLTTCYQTVRFSIATRTHWNQSNSGLVAEADHLTLFLAIQQVVVVLHRDELGKAVLLSGVLQGCELVRPHGAGT